MSEKIIIVAMTKDRVIGNNNTIPWHISDDLKLFKKHTIGHTIIMGRNTYESIGRSLPNRNNIIISTTIKKIDGAFVFKSFEDALKYAETLNTKIFFIGGSKVYEKALNLANYLYISHIKINTKGNVYFPDYDFTEWTENNCVSYKEFDFITYKKSTK